MLNGIQQSYYLQEPVKPGLMQICANQIYSGTLSLYVYAML